MADIDLIFLMQEIQEVDPTPVAESVIADSLIGVPIAFQRQKSDFYKDMGDDLSLSVFEVGELGDEGTTGHYYFASVDKLLPINGILDEEYYAGDTSADPNIESSQIMFWCHTVDLIHPITPQDYMYIRGVRYFVNVFEPDIGELTGIPLQKE